MVELADTMDLGSIALSVRVRVPLSALSERFVGSKRSKERRSKYMNGKKMVAIGLVGAICVGVTAGVVTVICAVIKGIESVISTVAVNGSGAAVDMVNMIINDEK